jgi:hypothetical protein
MSGLLLSNPPLLVHVLELTIKGCSQVFGPVVLFFGSEFEADPAQGKRARTKAWMRDTYAKQASAISQMD